MVKKIFGVTGTATVSSLGGYKCVAGTTFTLSTKTHVIKKTTVNNEELTTITFTPNYTGIMRFILYGYIEGVMSGRDTYGNMIIKSYDSTGVEIATKTYNKILYEENVVIDLSVSKNGKVKFFWTISNVSYGYGDGHSWKCTVQCNFS